MAYRLNLVSTGLGSSTAFLAALLYEAAGIQAVALTAAAVSALHTSLIAFYVARRGAEHQSALSAAKAAGDASCSASLLVCVCVCVCVCARARACG